MVPPMKRKILCVTLAALTAVSLGIVATLATTSARAQIVAPAPGASTNAVPDIQQILQALQKANSDLNSGSSSPYVSQVITALISLTSCAAGWFGRHASQPSAQSFVGTGSPSTGPPSHA